MTVDRGGVDDGPATGRLGWDDALLAAGGVRFDVSGEIARVTLDRPRVHNAQLPVTWEALQYIGSHLPDAARVVIVGGAGPSFSAGLDRSAFEPGQDGVLARLAAMNDADADAAIAGFQNSFRWLNTSPAVSVAAVHGHAIGAGFQLALACDLVVVADSARFRMAEVGLGLVPDLGGTGRLAGLVGRQRALEICATARVVTGEEAARLGIALRCVPAGELADAAAALAADLVRQPDSAVRAVTRLVRAAGVGHPDEQWARERTAQIAQVRALAAALTGAPG